MKKTPEKSLICMNLKYKNDTLLSMFLELWPLTMAELFVQQKRHVKSLSWQNFTIKIYYERINFSELEFALQTYIENWLSC